MSDSTPEGEQPQEGFQADFEPDPDFEYEPLEAPGEPAAGEADAYASSHSLGSSYDPMPLSGQIDTSRNWFGVVSIIFGVFPGAIIAIVFGILGLNAVKQGKANNRSLSVAGIALGILWTLVGIAGLIAATQLDKVDTGTSARVGDCYVSTLETTGDLSAEPAFGACTAASTGQVYYVTVYGGNATPADETFLEDVASLCTSEDAVASVDATLTSEYFVELYVPFADEWDSQPHTVICGLTTDGEPINPDAVRR